jgi:hypothetical protein
VKSSRLIPAFLLIVTSSGLLLSQQPATTPSSGVVPQLVNFSGKAVDAQGKTISGIAGVTFAIYKDQYKGAALWMETQNVNTDARGNYTVQLGATGAQGLPLDLFATGEARWLGVRINGGEEQPRVLLLSVPYALKAADAETIGGFPPSAFVLAAPPTSSSSSTTASAAPAPATSLPALSGTGTTDFVPLWTNSTALGNSVLFQSGMGRTAKLGINTTTPASALDVKGGETVRGLLSLPATGTATMTGGKNSQPLTFAASTYNSSTGTAASQTFQWQAESTNNNTSTASGTLNLLFAQGSNKYLETGLHIAGNGQITFAPGQAFPGTGAVSSVGLSAPTSDFTVSGSPVTGSGTLGLNWTVAPTNLATANAIVKRDSSGGIQVGYVLASSALGYPSPVSGEDTSNGLGPTFGVYGSSLGGNGVYGTGPTGVYGTGKTYGVFGLADTVNDGANYGVYGKTIGTSGYGVFGTVGFDDIDGVHGESSSQNSGVAGLNFNSTSGYGVYGQAQSPGGIGVAGIDADGTSGYGVYGQAASPGGIGGGFYNYSTGDALFAYNQSGGFAAFFDGDVDVDGNLSKAGGSFKIDHPLDPADKYLYHSFVESPDMKNIYDGVATLDANGEAAIQMPDWFGVLNRDFRYQLTCIGGFAPVYIAEELGNNQFRIGGGRAGMRVSWQITGIRQDPWANAHRIPVEEEKEAKLKGFYLHPELYGAPAEKQIEWARHPGMMKKLQQTTEQMKEKRARLTESAELPQGSTK